MSRPSRPPRTRDALDTIAGFAAFGALWGAWAAVLPAVQDEVEASKGELGLALLCVGVGSLPAMLLAGPAVNRFGPRVMAVALAALAAATLVLGLAGTLPALAGALVLVGAGAGAVDVSINAAAADFEARTQVHVMQLAHAMFSAGVIAGALAAGLARQADASPQLVLTGVAAVLAAVAVWNRGQPGRDHADGPPARLRLRRRAVVLGLACLAAFLVEGGIENWSAIFLEREHGTTPAVSALGPSAYATAMVLGRLLGHRLSPRLGDRVLVGSGALLSALGLLLSSVAPGVPLTLVGFFLGGAGVSVAAPAAFAAAGRGATAAERGSAVATVTTIGYLGFLVGPGVAGGVAEAVGLRGTFVLLALVSAGLALAAARLPLEGPVRGQASAASVNSS